MLAEEQWHYGYVWHRRIHHHTPRQLWFPQVAALSLQREDLSAALFNTDVKTRAAAARREEDEVDFWDVHLTLLLIDRETSSQFNPACLTEPPLNDQVVTQLNLSSCSCSRGFAGSKGFSFKFDTIFLCCPVGSGGSEVQAVEICTGSHFHGTSLQERIVWT